MLGNWATGNVTAMIPPIMTIRIEMTIATMGLLMKKLDIPFDSFDSWVISNQGSLAIALECFRLHPHTCPQVLLTFDDHAFSNLNRAYGDPIVGSDGVDHIAALLVSNGRLRNQ